MKNVRVLLGCLIVRAVHGNSSRTLQTRAVVVASVLGALAVSHPCHAQPAVEQKSVPRSFGAELTAINACVREVRATTGSRFDAHLNARGAMRYMGTELEVAAFKRCMQAKGFPTESN